MAAASSLPPSQARALLVLLAEITFEPLILAEEGGSIITANRAACDALLPPDNVPPDSDLAANPLTANQENALIGRDIADFIDGPELEDMIYCAFSDDNDCPEMQFPIRGRTYRVRCAGVDYGSVRYLAIALQDITQLLRLNRARRDMVANISHELRTPIANIRLLNETFNRQRLGKKQRQKIVRKIGRELDTLQRIVEGMRDLSMIESGQAIMRLMETPLLPLINEALESLEEQVAQRKLKVGVEVPETLYVLVDTGQIGRVLANMIHNAVKFTPKRGRIQVTAELHPEEDMVTLCISDSGPGIPPEERERVFERFYQIDEARSSGSRGSGLGLAIAKHIVAAHGGRVWVQDSPMGGACLCFTLPATSLPPEGMTPVQDEESP